MNVTENIQNRINQEAELISNLEATLPTLRKRLELANQQADQVEATLLLQESSSGELLNLAAFTQKDLQAAKKAERERQLAVDQTERELRVSRLLKEQLEAALTQVKKEDIDGKLQELEKRLPKIAKKLADAWLAFEKVASEADDVKNEQRRLKALVPLKGVPVSLSRPVPTIPALEQIRRKHPRESQMHPASALRRLGYEDLAEKVTPS